MSNPAVFQPSGNPLPLSPDSLAAFRKMREEIIQQSTALILKTGEFQQIFGENAHEIVLNGLTFTAKTLEAIMAVSSEEIMVQQLAWGKDYLSGVGISPQTVLYTFEVFAQAMQEKLPPDQHPGLAEWMKLMIARQREMCDAS